MSSTISSTPPPPYYWSAILWLFLAPALGGFLFGYDIGGTSYAILQLQGFDGSESMSLRNDPLKTGWFVAAPSGGALLGTALLLYLDQYSQHVQHGRNNHNHNNTKGSPLRRWGSRVRSVVTFQFLFAKPLGRQTELVYASVLYALGGCLQYAATGPKRAFAFAMVLGGRCLYGIGIGFAMHGGPTYLAETMPPSIRGMVVGAKEIAIVLGILCGYMVGNHYCTNSHHVPDGWAYVYGWSVVGALAMMVVSHTIPESPRFLVCSCANPYEDEDGDDHELELEPRISSEVLESLQCVWNPQRAREEHAKLLELYAKQRESLALHQSNNTAPAVSSSSSSPSLSALLSDPVLQPALRAGLGLVILQQITGQPSVLSYATPILSRVPGLDSRASVLLAAFKVVATSVSVVLVERYGRKTLLQVGCSMMLGALLVLAVAFQDSDSDAGTSSEGIDSDWIGMEAIEEDVDATTLPSSSSLDAKSVLALVGMFAYIAGYQIGFGPITWLMISEVFPLSVRATMVAVAVQTNFALNALVQLLVPILETSLGMSKTFLVFGCLSAYSVYFCQHSVPETKGLTLEEIEEKLSLLVTVEETDTDDVSAAAPGNQEGIFSETELLLRSGDTSSNTRRRTSQSTEQQHQLHDDDERIRLLP